MNDNFEKSSTRVEERRKQESDPRSPSAGESPHDGESLVTQGNEWAHRLARQTADLAPANPWPLITTAAGLLWLVLSKRSDTEREEPWPFPTSEGRDPESTASRFDRMGDQARSMAAQAEHQAIRARDGVYALVSDQPLVVGSIGVAIGAALGALMPTSRVERDMLGEWRETAVQSASGLAAQSYEALRSHAGQAADDIAERVSGNGEEQEDGSGNTGASPARPGA